MIHAGDRIRIKPEWRSKTEPEIVYFAVEDEANGRVGISPVEWNYKIRPIETVDASMLEVLPPATPADFAALAGTGKFVIVAKRDGKTMFASASGALASWTLNPARAYVYDAQDNGDIKLKYWRAIAKMHGLDPQTVEAIPCES